MSPAASPILRFLPLFLVALVVRAGTVALGVGLAGLPPRVLPPDDPSAIEVRERIQASGANVIEPLFRWDAVWMVNIGTHGYANAADHTGRHGVAFMPAAPAVFALGAALGLNPFWVVVVVVNLAGAAGAAVFARVAAHLLNDRAAGWRAFLLLLAFPTAFFYSAAYNESFGLLFTALALGAWWANRPALAGIAAFLGSLARLTGIALGMAAVGDWLLRRDRNDWWRAASLAAGSFAGLVLVGGVLWWAVGDPLAGLKSHAMWGRRDFSLVNPLYAIRSIYDPHLFRPGGATHFAWEAVAVVVFTALGVRAWRKRGAFWGLVVLVPIAQMFASGTLLSANRVLLAALPAFIELADLLCRPVGFIAAVLGLSFAQLLLLNRFVHWQFAG